MADFLLELRCEEIPARMQKGARADLEKLFRQQLDEAGIKPGAITVWSTPRRLALIAEGLPEQTEAVSEEAKGPPEGAPDQAVEGFCRKNGVTRDQLEVRDVKGRPTYFAVRNIPGRAVKDVLAEAIPAIIRAFPWPKSMRWGAASLRSESLRWVRPLSGIVAILGEELVECEVDGVPSGYATLGHRFHCPGPITIGGADDYAGKLRACHVIVDHAEREAIVREGAAKAAADAGLTLVEDEGLVVENAGLTEWPVPLLGRFDEAFLEVPPEVIQLTARTNQKYFVCEKDGKLANAFICTANIEASDGGAAIVDGNRKVLAARLSDARFFWDVDRKVKLSEQVKKLERITFHEKLGTVADKVERVAKLARWLVEEGIVTPSGVPAKAGTSGEGAGPNEVPAFAGTQAELADMAEQAARLCKADLVTEMVGEFPELQGLMGGYYARAEGLPDAVADAIRDHYKPVGQGDDVPTAPVTVAVSLADKLDTLVGFFQIDEKPTGSKDPFALRRAALGILRLILENGLRASMFDLIAHAAHHGKSSDAGRDIANFLIERLKVQQRDANIRHDMIDAVVAVETGGDNVRMVNRTSALQRFLDTEDGANLLAGYKRAANILKKEDWHGIEAEIPQTGEEDPLAEVDDPDLKPVIAAKMAERHAKELSYTPDPAEKALIDALDEAQPRAAAAIEAEDFEAAMAALAALRAPIDRFFDEVTVNVPDKDKRASRLDLLDRFRAAVHQVADFSKIEG
ncbi:glycyl-tRNA synthetase beta chain [Altererythrobacter atlanticus]|uniref:Glycine--tRNA ligase beta subunit n=1 Tax=Croceibacterium atlanticum TaxID=1267766 RepID=A0A0F7KLY2_9SPHN|nr:glycine--tRNA ligase subunit beta [Croceibacterium atlanticum]AKH41548.1 Glycine--tRNA ligase beta subunit [Croceibacterium atlanticum]MBB5733010.1 glycyl-tRNA synthetase beta chain [Croceibacterium atlanticum]